MNIADTLPRYAASCPLQTEFVKNADSCGDHVFTQVKRQGSICLYKRTGVSDGRPKGYELFRVKVVKAGASLPGGGKVEADYEQYPSANSFGRTAMSITGIGAEVRSEQLFELWAANPELSPSELHGTTAVTTEAGQAVVSAPRAARRKNPYTPLPLPQGEFGREDFAKLNGMPWQPVNSQSYGALMKEIKAGRVKEVRQVDGAKGRKRTLYVEVKGETPATA